MSSLKSLIILSIFIAAINAATWIDPDAKTTICDENNKCEDYCKVEDDQLLKPGQSYKTKTCSEIFCTAEYTARGVTCGVVMMNGCQMEPDFTLQYPDCCYKICQKSPNDSNGSNWDHILYSQNFSG